MAEKPKEKAKRLATLAPEAKTDLLAIYTYTAWHWGNNQAERYLEFLNDTIEELTVVPRFALEVSEFPGMRRYTAIWKSARHGHRIFFREVEEGIYVLRILHTAQDWPNIFTE